ncbi:MAG: hypothetical protein AAGF47_03040, partial [Planctomycetota bacterium]
MTRFVSVAAIAAAGAAQGQTISLASTMDSNGFVSEDSVTFSFAQISAGDGSLGSAGANTGDADGLYSLSLLGQPVGPDDQFGTPVDLFPREDNFQ